MFTYAVGQAPDGDAKLVLTIADDAGRQVRRLDATKTAGLNRITWNLRGETAAAEGRGGGRGGPPPAPLVAAGPLSGDARAAERRHGHADRKRADVSGRGAAEVVR